MRISGIRMVIFLGLLWALLNACANIGKPSGGEKDSRGPEVLGVIPPPGARFVQDREIVFYFDEFLKSGNYAKEVFISPLPRVRPEVIVLNKKLILRLKDELLPNTSYVITLGKEIKDFNEGNKMSSSYTYAFSTGAQLDSLSFRGRVISAWESKPQEGMTMMLFPADSVKADSIFGRRPVYAVETDEKGFFEFKYLRPGNYKVYGVADVDGDYSYSQEKEAIALTNNRLVEIKTEDSLKLLLNFLSFVQDSKGPKVKSLKWVNDQVFRVEASEKWSAKIPSINVLDSLGVQNNVKTFRVGISDPTLLYCVSPIPRGMARSGEFVGLCDSLGNQSDTTLKFNQDVWVKEEQGKWSASPYFDFSRSAVVLPLLALPQFSSGDTSVRLVDSVGKDVPSRKEIVGLDFYIYLKNKPLGGKKHYIYLDSTANFSGIAKRDSTVLIPVSIPDPLKMGSISGVIQEDSVRPSIKFVVKLTGPPLASGNRKEKGKNVEFILFGPGPFMIPMMPAGTYQVSVVEDVDGNGVLTPGSLSPYRLPEVSFTLPDPIEVKGNWDTKNVQIRPKRNSGEGKAATNSGKKVVPGLGK